MLTKNKNTPKSKFFTKVFGMVNGFLSIFKILGRIDFTAAIPKANFAVSLSS